MEGGGGYRAGGGVDGGFDGGLMFSANFFKNKCR